jgi:hypothetical protein
LEEISFENYTKTGKSECLRVGGVGLEKNIAILYVSPKKSHRERGRDGRERYERGREERRRKREEGWERKEREGRRELSFFCFFPAKVSFCCNYHISVKLRKPGTRRGTGIGIGDRIEVDIKDGNWD